MKNGMYSEALDTAGFGRDYNFRRLGFKELDDAGVPMAKVAALIANWDLPGEYFEEAKRWIKNSKVKFDELVHKYRLSSHRLHLAHWISDHSSGYFKLQKISGLGKA
ncbi:MAG: hypothetical protein R2877_07820 [Bdellovibrionota bacterium]